MARSYRYFKKTGEVIDRHGSWDGDSGYHFNYEPDSENYSKAVINVVTEYFSDFITKNCPELKDELRERVAELIKEHDLEDALADAFEDELKEYFEREALDSECRD
jgi:hypothetical protein